MTQRPIKFRVWNDKAKKMDFVGGVVWDKGQIVEVDVDDGPEVIDPILMQYTGLTDKNGTEIYDGDYLNVVAQPVVTGKNLSDFQKENPYKIYWCLTQAGFALWSLKSTSSLPIPMYGVAGYIDAETYTVEVIGNIYENPVLLKEAV